MWPQSLIPIRVNLQDMAFADHMRGLLVIDALSHAHGVRGSLDGAVFHSDHGSVYTSLDFRNYCSSLGVRQSMTAVGTSADNALAESFNAALKREVLRDRKVFDNPIDLPPGSLPVVHALQHPQAPLLVQSCSP